MKLLLHICCAPCTIYPLKILRSEGHKVEGFFYNPNIHPYTEFKRRREMVKSYSAISELRVIFDDNYNLEGFLTAALKAGADRCVACYRIRLERAFREASRKGYEAMTTTLLYSTYQRHEEIKSLCEEFSVKHGIAFLYHDFREGWKEGQDEARRLELYRQPYCGCIFSERDRYYR